MGTTEEIARFIAGPAPLDPPAEVAARARRAIADCIGCALAGTKVAPARMVIDHVRENGGAPRASVIGTDLRTALADAAFANGMLCSALLYDDSSLSMKGHSSATLVPIILGLGETLHLTGKAMLDAYLVGWELESALGLAVGPGHYERGWHATATIGSLGAAAAACRLLGLDVQTTRMALGLATTMTGGSRQNFGTMTQALHGALPARSGILAADLAARGMTADPDIIESRMGFFALYGSETSNADLDPSRLGRDWEFLKPVLAMKLYPCGFPIHRPIEGTIELAREHGLKPDDIAAMRCGVHYLVPETVFHDNPQTGLQGKTSIQYCMARALIDGHIGLAQFTDEKVQDPVVRALMARVTVEVPPELSREAMRGKVHAIAAPALIEITLKDGTVLNKRVEHYRGAPERPLSEADIAGKFMDCAEGVIEPARARAVLDCVADIETLSDGAELAALLTP